MLEIWENVSGAAQSMWAPVGLWLSNPENWAVGVMILVIAGIGRALRDD